VQPHVPHQVSNGMADMPGLSSTSFLRSSPRILLGGPMLRYEHFSIFSFIIIEAPSVAASRKFCAHRIIVVIFSFGVAAVLCAFI